MCRLEAMAVRAQDPKVLETVVVAVAVDVIELDRDSSIRSALGPAAELATLLL
jgi:hypothetical protein